jgi:hypothetical protein
VALAGVDVTDAEAVSRNRKMAMTTVMALVKSTASGSVKAKASSRQRLERRLQQVGPSYLNHVRQPQPIELAPNLAPETPTTQQGVGSISLERLASAVYSRAMHGKQLFEGLHGMEPNPAVK